jgi:hypothetical protein
MLTDSQFWRIRRWLVCDGKVPPPTRPNASVTAIFGVPVIATELLVK